MSGAESSRELGIGIVGLGFMGGLALYAYLINRYLAGMPTENPSALA